jgi:ABC-type amino acid transport system permease subunit
MACAFLVELRFMSSLTISLIVFGCTFGAVLLGMLLRYILPEHHLSTESKDVIKLAVGVVGTLTAMILGLLVASAKNTFDSQRAGVSQLAGNVIALDRMLAHYGPETKETRAIVRASVADLIDRTWPHDGSSKSSDQGAPMEGRSEEVIDHILALTPKTDAQKAFQSEAVKIASDTGKMRWSLYAQRQGSSIPSLFLVVLVFWLAVTLGSFGLFAPRNPTAVFALSVCAAAVSCAIFLILELDHPFTGIIQIPGDPLRSALEHLGR